MATAGVTVGLAASFGIMRLLRAELFGVRPSDPLTYTVAAAVLLMIALAAACVPAIRAVHVDPLLALRHE
jgi:putative ABC transport system permease protein